MEADGLQRAHVVVGDERGDRLVEKLQARDGGHLGVHAGRAGNSARDEAVAAALHFEVHVAADAGHADEAGVGVGGHDADVLDTGELRAGEGDADGADVAVTIEVEIAQIEIVEIAALVLEVRRIVEGVGGNGR
jgi:hypothetical protein